MDNYTPHKSSILYIDDEVSNLTNFKFVFRKYYDIHLAESAEEGFELLKEHKVHLIIADQRMPQMTGATFLANIADQHPEISRIIITGYSDIDAIIDAINRGRVYHYVSKPWDPSEFKVVIDNALEVYWLKHDNKKLVDSLTDSNKELDTFLYRSSHDLRRPITTMLGLSQLAKMTPLGPEAEELFTKVEETAHGMNKMLQKLYMVNDIHAGIEETEPVDFDNIHRKIRQEYGDLITAYNIDFQFHVEKGLRFGAPDRLIRNILLNTVENAVLFNAGEHPYVHVQVALDEEGLQLQIEDNGVGIPPKYHEKIFNMYFIANESSKGNGLGLYVVKRTVDILGGTMELTSDVGQGTTFKIFIPKMEKVVQLASELSA
ncbi:MAG: hybrid sensor histidine kinase/response regulator [Flammeovirgaceae bacterium]